jgi:hypothetical protein
MDKPELLQSILNNHPDVSIELIQKLAQEEIDRQIKVSIDGMLYKKPIGILKQVAEYVFVPEPIPEPVVRKKRK